MAFVKAMKKQAKGRLALIGVSGGGKTWTALEFAKVLAGPSGNVALIDTENASASKYADTFAFDTNILTSFTPQSYINAIHEAETAGYDVLVIDSLSHAWAGKDGVLAMVDNATARSKSGNAFASGWREVTPQHNALVDALVQCKCHLIVTMRSKTEWVIEEVNGKKVPRKLGLAPVQRDGLEYEFDVVGDIDGEHKWIISKSRCPALADGVFIKPGADVATKFRDWLSDGTPVLTPASTGVVQDAEAMEKSLMERGTTDPMTDADKFEAILHEAFDAAGFEMADRPAVIASACKTAKITRVTDLPPDRRNALVKAINDGKFNKLKKHSPAAA
jgi:hypothetical protein